MPDNTFLEDLSLVLMPMHMQGKWPKIDLYDDFGRFLWELYVAFRANSVLKCSGFI